MKKEVDNKKFIRVLFELYGLDYESHFHICDEEGQATTMPVTHGNDIDSSRCIS